MSTTEDRPTWPQPGGQPAPEPKRRGVPGWVKGTGLFIGGTLVGILMGTAGAPQTASAPAEIKTVTETEQAAEAATEVVTETVTEVVTEQAAAPAPEPPPAPAAQTWGDGLYLVGTDIPPGTYRTDDADEGALDFGCYWARLSSTSGELDSIIANENFEGQHVMTIDPGDVAVEFNGGCVWRPA